VKRGQFLTRAQSLPGEGLFIPTEKCGERICRHGGRDDPCNVPGHLGEGRLWVYHCSAWTGFARADLNKPRTRTSSARRIEDNRSRHDRKYRRTLERFALTPAARRFSPNGDWNVFAGQYFRHFRYRPATLARPGKVAAGTVWPRLIVDRLGASHIASGGVLPCPVPQPVGFFVTRGFVTREELHDRFASSRVTSHEVTVPASSPTANSCATAFRRASGAGHRGAQRPRKRTTKSFLFGQTRSAHRLRNHSI